MTDLVKTLERERLSNVCVFIYCASFTKLEDLSGQDHVFLCPLSFTLCLVDCMASSGHSVDTFV